MILDSSSKTYGNRADRMDRTNGTSKSNNNYFSITATTIKKENIDHRITITRYC